MNSEIKIDNYSLNLDDTYTYKQILIGLRNEFLKLQEQLDKLNDYVVMFPDKSWITNRDREEYHFDLYPNPYKKNFLPELALNRIIIRKRLLEIIGLNQSPSRTFMVKNNNGVYSLLRRNWFEKYQFNMIIKPEYEKEFQECVEEILNSNLAKYMQLNDHIRATDYNSKNNTIIKPNLRSYGFDLCTRNGTFRYFGRYNILEFASVRQFDSKYQPLTQECLNFVSEIRFPKEVFSEYHQNIIENSIDDDKIIVLSDEYKPETHTKFIIVDEPKKLTLTKTLNKTI